VADWLQEPIVNASAKGKKLIEIVALPTLDLREQPIRIDPSNLIGARKIILQRHDSSIGFNNDGCN